MRNRLVKFLIVIFFVIVAALITHTLWILSHTYTPDFSVYYQAAKNLISSSSLYTGKQTFTSFSYPLVSAVLFVAFTYLPYQTAQTIFLFLSFVALTGISIIIPKIITNKYSWLFSVLILSLSYLSFPTKFTLGMGQINLIAYFLTLLCVLFYQKKKTLWVAFVFGIACVCKPVLGIIILFFVIKKEWKIIGYMVLVGLVVFLISLLIDHHAIADYLYYFQKMLPEVSKPVGKEIYYNQGIMSFVFREVSNTYWRLLLSYVGMASVCIVGLYAAAKSKNILLQFAIFCSMLPLIDTLSWQHHFVFLIFPFTYAFWFTLNQKQWMQFAILCVGYALVSWNFAHPELFTPLLLSNTFYGGLVLFIVLVRLSLI